MQMLLSEYSVTALSNECNIIAATHTYRMKSECTCTRMWKFVVTWYEIRQHLQLLCVASMIVVPTKPT